MGVINKKRGGPRRAHVRGEGSRGRALFGRSRRLGRRRFASSGGLSLASRVGERSRLLGRVTARAPVRLVLLV